MYMKLWMRYFRYFVMLILPSLATATSLLPSHIMQYGCQSCHALDTQRSAPSFQSIALRYTNQIDVKNQLMLKLRRGTVGGWGKVAMPPQVMVSDEALPSIIEWVLAQKPVARKEGGQ
jgi:cytochrome c